MKKILLILLVFVMVFAFATSALADTGFPAGGITITAKSVDYVSALAGIAKPISGEFHENERVAVLVTVNIPSWFDVANMKVVIEQNGVMLDSNCSIAVASGNYLLFGTLYSTSGSLKITIQDNMITNATTVQELWSALYGDRTVSTTLNFFASAAVPVAGSTYNGTSVPVTPVLEIPQTGDASSVALPVAMIALAFAILLFARKRKCLSA